MIVERFEIPFYMEEKQKIVFKLFLSTNTRASKLESQVDFLRAFDLLELFFKPSIDTIKRKEILNFYLRVMSLNKTTVDLKKDLKESFEDYFNLMGEYFTLENPIDTMFNLHNLILDLLPMHVLSKHTDDVKILRLDAYATVRLRNTTIHLSRTDFTEKRENIDLMINDKDDEGVLKEKLDALFGLYASFFEEDVIDFFVQLRKLGFRDLYIELIRNIVFHTVLSNNFNDDNLYNNSNVIELFISAIISAINEDSNSEEFNILKEIIYKNTFNIHFHETDLFKSIAEKLGKSKQIDNMINDRTPFNIQRLQLNIKDRFRSLVEVAGIEDEVFKLTFVNITNMLFMKLGRIDQTLSFNIVREKDKQVLELLSDLEEAIVILKNTIKPKNLTLKEIGEQIENIEKTFEKFNFDIFFNDFYKEYLFREFGVKIATLIFVILPNYMLTRSTKNSEKRNLEIIDILKIILNYYWRFIRNFQNKIKQRVETQHQQNFPYVKHYGINSLADLNIVITFENDYSSKKVLRFEDPISMFKQYVNKSQGNFLVKLAIKIDKSNFISINYDIFDRFKTKEALTVIELNKNTDLILKNYISAIEYICNLQEKLGLQKLIDFFNHDESVLELFINSLNLKEEDKERIHSLVLMYTKLNEVCANNSQKLKDTELLFEGSHNNGDEKDIIYEIENNIANKRLYNIYEIQNEMRRFNVYYAYEDILIIIFNSGYFLKDNEVGESIFSKTFIDIIQKHVYKRIKSKLKIRKKYFWVYFMTFLLFFLTFVNIIVSFLKDIIFEKPVTYILLFVIFEIFVGYICLMLFLPIKHSYMEKLIDDFFDYNHSSGRYY